MQNEVLTTDIEIKPIHIPLRKKLFNGFLEFFLSCIVCILLFSPIIFFKDKAYLIYIGIFLFLFLLALLVCFFEEILAILLVAGFTIGLAFLLNSFLGTLTIPAILLSIALIILFKPLRNN